MEKEEITTLMVDDDYAPVITEEEACELKPILNGFVEAYVQNSKKAIKEWLPQKIKESLPEASDEQVDEIIDDIEVSIKANEDAKNALIEAKKSGRTRDSWLSEQIEKSTSGMSQEQAIKYLTGLDEALANSNKAFLNTVTTNAGSINQNPHLDGFIAERMHAESFNLNAQARGSEYRAEVLEPAAGERYGKNSVDIVIKNGAGKIVKRYQVKFCQDAEATEQAFNNGDYRGQRSLVPEDQAQDINRNTTTVLEAPDGTKSEPLTKQEAKELQEKTQNGEIKEFDWNNFSIKDIAKHAGQQAGFACIQGAVIGVGFDIAHKFYNKEEIKPKEELVVALKTGGDFGLKSILGSAIKVASEKGVIKFIPKGTPAGVCGTIAFVGVENLKVLTKVATGDLTPREGADKMADVTASTVGGLVSMKFVTKWGKKGGEILGMIVGGVFGGGAGASIGKKIGAVAGGFIAGSVAYMAGSKTGHAVYSAAKKVVASAATTVKQVAKNIISSAKNLIANAKAKAKQIFC